MSRGQSREFTLLIILLLICLLLFALLGAIIKKKNEEEPGAGGDGKELTRPGGGPGAAEGLDDRPTTLPNNLIDLLLDLAAALAQALLEQAAEEQAKGADPKTTIDEAVKQAFNESLAKFEADVQAVVDSGKPMSQTEINAALDQAVANLEEDLKSALNLSDGNVLEQVDLQNEINKIRNAVNDAFNEEQSVTINVGTGADVSVQTALTTRGGALGDQFVAEGAVGTAGTDSSVDIKARLDAEARASIDQLVNAMTAAAGTDASVDIKARLDAAARASIDKMISQILPVDGGVADIDIKSKLNEAIQATIEKFTNDQMTSDGGTSTITIQTALNLAASKVFNENWKRMHVKASKKSKSSHMRTATVELERMIQGIPKVEDGKVEINYIEAIQIVRPHIDLKRASAFGFIPGKTNLQSSPSLLRALSISFSGLKRQARNNLFYRGATAIPRGIDYVMNNEYGARAFQLIDNIDTAMDVLSVLGMFIDVGLYDPNGEGLDWEPLDGTQLRDQRERMIKKQLETIRDYNIAIDTKNMDPSDDNYPYLHSNYPLISGPLQDIQMDPDDQEDFRASHGNKEYNQARVVKEVDAVRESLLRNVSSKYHGYILNASFFGEQDLMTEILLDPTERLVDYVGDLPSTQQEELYEDAYRSVCVYHGGKVYIDPVESSIPGGMSKRFQCGYANYTECERSANEWISSGGQLGAYAEWFNFNDLKYTNDAGENVDLVPAGATLRNTGDSACVITGYGQRALCNDSHGRYDPLTHECGFTKEICQNFGTCYNESTNKCFIPPRFSQIQGIFGQKMPREWIRLNGCTYSGGKVSSIVDLCTEMGRFSGMFAQYDKVFADIWANQSNWGEGFKRTLGDKDAIANMAMIVIPLFLEFSGAGAAMGVSSGLMMFAIMIVMGSMMADAAVVGNRYKSQMAPNEPTEYSTGGWVTTDLDFHKAVYIKITSMTIVLPTSIDEKYRIFVVTDTPHGLKPGNKIRITGDRHSFIGALPDGGISVLTGSNDYFYYEYGLAPTTAMLQNPELYVSYIPDKTLTYSPSLQYTNRKIINPIGYVPGWITKPLRPKKPDGSIVPLNGTVSQIEGCIENDFYVDVDVITQQACSADVGERSCPGVQFPSFANLEDVFLSGGVDSIGDMLKSLTVTITQLTNVLGSVFESLAGYLDGRDVNTRIHANYAAATFLVSAFGLASHDVILCAAHPSLRQVSAYSDICLMATAVNSATGTIGGLIGGGAHNFHSDDWMDKSEYKRLCSQMSTPMIRAWDASLANKLWCLPESPPENWYNPNIGELTKEESPYARNRSWTSGIDPYVAQIADEVMGHVDPNVSDSVLLPALGIDPDTWVFLTAGAGGLGGSSTPATTTERDTASYWYYQLVYDVDKFNRANLWDDGLLLQTFTPTTITEMRQYYCQDDLAADLSGESLDDRCWGYLSISLANYKFLPMTMLARATRTLNYTPATHI